MMTTPGPAHVHIAPENDYRALADVPVGQASLRAAVVIPIYNRTELLARVLAGLRRQSYPGDLLEVVVADDGSDEDVAGVVEREAGGLRVRTVRHEGFGAGLTRNLGASATDADVVVFIDADSIPDPELVARHLDWHHRASNLVVLGSRHHVDASRLDAAAIAAGEVDLRTAALGDADPADERLVPGDFRRVLYRRTSRMVHGDEAFRALVSSNFSVRRDLFSAVGGFSADLTNRASRSGGGLPRWGGEDTELGWRLYVAGAFFVPEDRAISYHQTQEDTWDDGGRASARAHNEGLVQTKIPHRFYRTSKRGHIYEVPRVSWIVVPTRPERASILYDQMLEQRFTDWEAVFLDDGQAVTLLAEENRADPRMRVVPPGDEDSRVIAAIGAARGEYVAILNGDASLDGRLLSRVVRKLDTHPRSSIVSCGYRIPSGRAWADFRKAADASSIDAGWVGRSGLPPFRLVRRRELSKALRVTSELDEAWRLVESISGMEHESEALVGLPAASPPPTPAAWFPPLVPDRSLAVRDLKATRSPVALARVAGSYAVSRLTRTAYRGGERPADPSVEQRQPRAGKPVVRQLGGSGVAGAIRVGALRDLVPWAEVTTSGDPQDLVILGGGSQIGDPGGLEWLSRVDGPRLERVVFGAGVSDRTGPVSDARGWTEFLSTCSLVGIRGPVTEQVLRKWGYRGELEVVGDLALSVETPTVTERDGGSVVIVGARSRGSRSPGPEASAADVLSSLATSLRAEGRDVVFVSWAPRDDRRAFEIMRASGAPGFRFVAAYDGIEHALTAIASAGLVVAERTIAVVLAAACGTPFVGIEGRSGIRDVAAALDRMDDVARTEDLGRRSIEELVDRVDRDRAAIARSLTERVADYRRLARSFADEVRDVLGAS